jgi:hypothetical protein
MERSAILEGDAAGTFRPAGAERTYLETVKLETG